MRNIFITIFLLLCAYILWPYIAVFSLYIALKTGDTLGVQERVDWPSLKKDLRINFDNLVKSKLQESRSNKGIQFSFDSLSLSKEISDKTGTPRGLIYLFNKPNEFVEQIRRVFKNTIQPEKINPPVPEKQSFEPEGPNFPNLFERIEYAFFIEPDIFRLSFKEGDLSFTLDAWLREPDCD